MQESLFASNLPLEPHLAGGVAHALAHAASEIEARRKLCRILLYESARSPPSANSRNTNTNARVCCHARACRKEHPRIYFLVSCMIHLFHFIDVTVRRLEEKKKRRKKREKAEKLFHHRRIMLEALPRARSRRN